MNLPNTITFSRLLGLPFIFILLIDPTSAHRWWATGIFAIAAATDWLDGYLARKLNQITEIGKFLDPLVDKLLVLGPFLILIQWQVIPAWAVFLILGRELVIAGWRVSGSGAISGANLWGKLKTVSQIFAIALLLAPLDEAWKMPALIVFWLAVMLTLISGLIYVLPTNPDQNKV